MNEERPSLRLLPALGALALTLLAFGLRLHRLDFQPLWGDEGWSFYFASMSLGEMMRLTAEDIHPPLYYALLGGWLRLVEGTPEIARFLSIMFGTALVPVAYRLARRLYDRVAGLATAAVVAVAPFAIYYSQEVRMYGLVTLLGLASVYFFVDLLEAGREPSADGRPQAAQDKRSKGYALGYVLTTTMAFYTMYYAVFIPLFQLVYFLTTNRGRKLKAVITHPFIRSLSVAVLLYLPWVILVGAKLATYVQGKRVAEDYTPLGLLHFVASHVIAFSVGHLSDATRVLAWTTLLFLPIAFLGLFYRSSRTAHHASRNTQYAIRNTQYASRTTHHALLVALYLLLPLLLGYLINLVYPFTPRYFERTLMLVAPAWWLLLGAGLAWLWRRSRLALVGVAAGVLLVQMVMLLDFYNIPRYQDEDYRPLLAYVRAHSSPDDVFLASYQWQVGYYHAYLPPPRPALHEVPGWGETWAEDTTRMHADLDVLISDHPRLWFPAYQALGRLWEAKVEAYLNRTAFPAQVDWSLPSTKLLLYAQGDQLAPADAPFNFANQLLVERVEVGDAPVEAGRGVLPITLMWRKLDSLGSDHRVALRLTDADGRTWASRDSLPQGGDASFTDLTAGERLIDRHGLTVPAGTPPGDYQLRLGVYDQADDHPLDVLDDQDQPQGTEAVLATIHVVLPGIPLFPDALPVQFPKPSDFDGRVRLLGYSLGNGPFQAGEPLTFSLFWQALTSVDEPYVVFAQLQDETGQPVAISETPPIYPSDRWAAGTLVRDPHNIPLPATLSPGTYHLAVGLLRPDGARLPVAGSDDQVVLTNVETTQRIHDSAPPSPQHVLNARFGDCASLVGYDLRGGTDAHPGESLTLVLYWEALETFDRPYTVFAHLVDADDHIFGQRDQVPGDGDFPTTSWVPGEYLTDAYAIPVNLDTPAGEYRIEIGFYDPLDGTRLPVTDVDDQPLGDRLLLEETRISVGE
jgi:4-amino-4-deoxy-L-arabinose transferase-like glycosyltransferase